MRKIPLMITLFMFAFFCVAEDKDVVAIVYKASDNLVMKVPGKSDVPVTKGLKVPRTAVFIKTLKADAFLSLRLKTSILPVSDFDFKVSNSLSTVLKSEDIIRLSAAIGGTVLTRSGKSVQDNPEWKALFDQAPLEPLYLTREEAKTFRLPIKPWKENIPPAANDTPLIFYLNKDIRITSGVWELRKLNLTGKAVQQGKLEISGTDFVFSSNNLAMDEDVPYYAVFNLKLESGKTANFSMRIGIASQDKCAEVTENIQESTGGIRDTTIIALEKSTEYFLAGMNISGIRACLAAGFQPVGF